MEVGKTEGLILGHTTSEMSEYETMVVLWWWETGWSNRDEEDMRIKMMLWLR